ncbi:hypothetical protein [Bacteroides nordii]|uniref:hypothetical protein n=1 Tax=Bacteroides nordii TaxID=291645 RepID=UPI00189EF00C|nr:hypothetical protein [Bacteroides nordii]
MKNLLILVLLFGGLFVFFSCEKNGMDNPGDFSLKAELNVVGISTKSGLEYPVNVIRAIDSTYVRTYERTDTVKDENGNYVLDADGKYTFEKVKISYEGNITAKFFELEKILLEPQADTLVVEIVTNSIWKAPMPSSGGRLAWFLTQKTAGGGDAYVRAAVLENTTKNPRKVDAVQYIFTSDSTVMYKLVFGQKTKFQ